MSGIIESSAASCAEEDSNANDNVNNEHSESYNVEQSINIEKRSNESQSTGANTSNKKIKRGNACSTIDAVDNESHKVLPSSGIQDSAGPSRIPPICIQNALNTQHESNAASSNKSDNFSNNIGEVVPPSKQEENVVAEDVTSREESSALKDRQVDSNTVEQVGDFVSLIMSHLPDESSIISGPSDDQRIEPLPSLHQFPAIEDPVARQRQTSPFGGFQSPTIHTFLNEARTLFSYYQCCLRLIEASSRPDFQYWDWLDECLAKMAEHPRVSDKMKLRYLLHNKNNPRTFNVIQKNFNLDLDAQFYMGKMNLLHIACDSGWADLVAELILKEKMDVNLICPSRHMKPGNLTPLMLASGAGHSDVVEVLLKRDDLIIDKKDKEGFTALFHACNHGTNRVGDPHGYFRRLWSWDLSAEQMLSMESIARQNSKEIIRLLITHGSDLQSKDNTGCNVLYRASTVENFKETIEFLVEIGCRVTHNILNWTRVKNPECVKMIEEELVSPKSLLRQARLVIWRSINHKLSNINQINNKNNECILPNVLVNYLNCN